MCTYAENYIDGQALTALPYDIEEFKILVWRMDENKDNHQ